MEALRIRSIKPEFWRSDDVAALSIEDRLLFIGLWSYVDDSGIGVDKLPHICADLFAHDLAESPAEVFARVTGGLQELSSRGMIQRYTVDGKPYLYVTSWPSHQRIDKPSKRRFPLPDQADRAGSSDPREDSARVPEIPAPGAVEQRSSGTGSTSDAARSDDPEGFAEFWSVYPRKEAKRAAVKAYRAALKRATAEDILKGAKRYAATRPEPRFTAMGATWLNADRWEDNPVSNNNAPSAPGAATRRTANGVTLDQW